jgi:hypothetical protein
VISTNIVVIDELDGPCDLDMVLLNAPMAAVAHMVVWATMVILCSSAQTTFASTYYS